MPATYRARNRVLVLTLAHMPELPRSVRLVAWGNAALAGHVSLDDAIDHIVAGDPPHRVAGLPGEPAPVSMVLALGRLRTHGVTALRLALPAPGDPAGLPGPPPVNAVAVEAREAALTVDGAALALIPSGPAQWQVYDVAPASPPVVSMAEAERTLTEELRECTEELVALDVARWGAEAAAFLAGQVRATAAVLPGSYPPRAHAVLAQATRIGAVAALAGRAEGAAVSAREIRRRAAVLDRLAAASRHAITAACNVPL